MKRTIASLSLMLVFSLVAFGQTFQQKSDKSACGACCSANCAKACCSDGCAKSCCPDGCGDDCCQGK